MTEVSIEKTEWNDVDVRLPEDTSDKIIMDEYGKKEIGYYDNGKWEFSNDLTAYTMGMEDMNDSVEIRRHFYEVKYWCNMPKLLTEGDER